MEDINLHFTGDFAAVEKAHNLLAAMIDNNIQSKRHSLHLDPRTISWKRVMDMNGPFSQENGGGARGELLPVCRGRQGSI